MIDVLNIVMDFGQCFWYLILITASAITTWKIKARYKRDMEYGFRRKVKDWELVSMNQWMEMYDAGDSRAAERRNRIPKEWIRL